MTDRSGSALAPAGFPDPNTPNGKLFFGAYFGSIREIEGAVADGADINYAHPQSGLCALHVALGANDFGMVRYLIEECGAAFFPDHFGRWPTLIAAECEVDDDLSDYIVEAEAQFLRASPPE